jgi:glycosyltransferase involved in cell wall biosynthesis
VRLSVFTPSHRPRYLDECYGTLLAQTYADWEWIVLLNGASGGWRPKAPDERVKVVRDAKAKGVGAAKRAACALASGDVLVELDHDDRLSTTCLERIAAAFEAHPGAALVFSDFAQIGADGSRNDERFDETNGWVYDEVEVDGARYLRCHALAATPHNLSYIWYAPNHVRAFRRSNYEQAGGYDAALQVLDDQDLMIRLYRTGDFHHIPECLYLQRFHQANTQVRPKTNAHIQTQTVAYYQDNIDALSRAWCERAGLKTVHLVVPDSTPPVLEGPGDVTLEFDPTGGSPRFEFEDSSVGAIRAIEVLAYVNDRAAFFNECHRVLAHGGIVFSQTPSTDGRGAFQDPSYTAWWNENSFWYLTQSDLRTSLPTLTGRFQVSHLRTHFPSEWHEQVNVPFVQANLLALKEGPRQGGPIEC